MALHSIREGLKIQLKENVDFSPHIITNEIAPSTEKVQREKNH